MSKKKEGIIKSVYKPIKFSPAEYAKILEKMEELHIVKFAQYARLKILSEGKIILQDEKEKGEKGGATLTQIKIVEAVNKIGINLNQITKALNEQLKTTGHPVNENELSSHMQTFSKQLQAIRNGFLYNKKEFNESQD